MPVSTNARPEFITPDWPAPPGVRALATTRAGGCSVGPWTGLNLGAHVGDDAQAVARNRALLVASAGLPELPLWLTQVHGTAVVDADAPPDVTADARHTARRGAVCVVLSADCLPLLLCDTDGTEVAAVHCGWRGLADGMVAAAVARFAAPPARLLAWLGPAIGAAAYQVGPELVTRFAPAARGAFGPGARGLTLDLGAAARALLAQAGVTRVYGGHWCTASDAARFYSYRRDGVTGRMATLIWQD